MVTFVGAGPGDPDLITVKGRQKIMEADIIIYTGSLVQKSHLAYAKKECEIYDSAKMYLEEILSVMERAQQQHKSVVRLHTGDPCIYGAIKEQMDHLQKLNIDYEIIPGVSSFCGAAARLKTEYTLPGKTQTVILTRIEGRTPVPKSESLESLAQHQATMILFLSIDKIEEVMKKLSVSYHSKTPVAVVYKATWEEEKIIRSTLEEIAEKTKQVGIQKTALIIVGDCLGEEYSLSKLYDKHFKTEFRDSI